jgi:hypothetical protein
VRQSGSRGFAATTQLLRLVSLRAESAAFRRDCLLECKHNPARILADQQNARHDRYLLSIPLI